jgi:hypothetical protein
MTVEFVRRVLAWCTLVDMAVLMVWWLMILVGGDLIYGLHGKWFKISRETFDAIHYCGMATFKIAIFIFNLVPYLVLRFIF